MMCYYMLYIQNPLKSTIINQHIHMNRLEAIRESIGGKRKEFIYSVPIGPKRKGETPIYRRVTEKDGLIKIPSEIKSLADFWDRSVKKFPQNPLIEDLTFSQVDQLMRKVGSWIKDRGHKLFFLYSLNCPYWTIADIASMNYGFVNVPLYDTLGHEAFDYTIEITEGTLIFTTKSLIPNLQKYLSKNKRNIKQICFFDQITKEDQEKLQKLGVKVSNFKEALNYNKVSQRPKLNLDTELTYSFTSGTTGIPKGVIYTHRMPISQCYGVVNQFQILPTDVHMSYLPIAHNFERFVIWSCIFYGADIQYAKHPIAEIVKDFAIIKPTTMPIVPRLLNKFYPILKALVEKQGNNVKARGLFGGRLRKLVTGSAPVSPAILTFFVEALGIIMIEGYGQTETTAASFTTYEGDLSYGHVGGPNGVTEFKLVDVPEMNYTTDKECPEGEICTRGDSVFKKYFKDPKNTAQTVDTEGWNHSGDIGRILPNGALKIIDRKKNIYKLQQGQYIAPEKIENVYVRNKFVAESFLYGDSLRSYNIAIIHPNLEALPAIAEKLGIKQKDVKRLCENPKITQFIFQEITKQAKDDGLFGFQIAKKIRLWHEPFAQLGIVTNTMKIQRNVAKNKFKDLIEELYKDN